jgi:hypothetical protein
MLDERQDTTAPWLMSRQCRPGLMLDERQDTTAPWLMSRQCRPTPRSVLTASILCGVSAVPTRGVSD